MRPEIAACYGSERLPRYTSYPTAPNFSEDINDGRYGEWLGAISAHETVSLYLHVPFCRSMCWYCGCHTSIVKRKQPIEVYAAALRCEIAMIAARAKHRLKVGHIHFGGGTPTIMRPEALTDLVESLRHSFFVLPNAEVAVEIDPRTLTAEMSDALGYCGVNRASLGVQSFDPLVQRLINREQSFEQTASATDRLRQAGVSGINFDLIYGLRGQTVASCVETVRQCLELSPDRLSVFGYAHVPSFKKHQRKIDEASLPGGAERHRQSEAIGEALQAAGYVRIGLDHFALPTDPMAAAQRNGRLHRNFQGYTTDPSHVLIGLGASSIGKLRQGYVQNEVSTRGYLERIASETLATRKGYALTAEDRLRGEIIERLMCDFRVNIDEICSRHGRQPASLLRASARLENLVSEGIVNIDGASLLIPEQSRFLVRNVAAAFDAHLEGATRTFSRAV